MSNSDQSPEQRTGLGAWVDLDPDGETDSPMRFPCRFPIKAMGRADSALTAVVLQIVTRHAPETTPAAVHTRPSREGNWLAVTVTIEASSRAQLDAIYRELTAHELVAYAL